MEETTPIIFPTNDATPRLLALVTDLLALSSARQAPSSSEKEYFWPLLFSATKRFYLALKNLLFSFAIRAVYAKKATQVQPKNALQEKLKREIHLLVQRREWLANEPENRAHSLLCLKLIQKLSLYLHLTSQNPEKYISEIKSLNLYYLRRIKK